MYRKVTVLLVLIQIMVFLPSCALHKPVEETIPISTRHSASSDRENENLVGETQSFSVMKKEAIDGRILQIDALVTLPDLGDMANIKLAPDEEKQNNLVHDWILSVAPKTQESKSAYQTDWIIEDGDEIQVALTVDSNNIGVHYINAVEDINSQSLEKEDNLPWVPHYITKQRPPLLNKSADEAAADASMILSQYSCFAYAPWNVVALDAEKVQSSGAYCIVLQPFYNGIPVFDHYTPSRKERIQSCKMYAWMSSDSLFSFQGSLLLTEIEKKEIDRAMTLDEAIEKVTKDFPIYAIGSNVTVTGICAAYYLQGSTEDDSCILVPGWAFECVDSNDQSLYESYYTCFYDFETGSLHLLHYF